MVITKLWIKLHKIFIYNLSVGISFHFSCVKIYSGVPGSCIKGMPNFMWNVQTLFQRGVPFYIWTSNQVAAAKLLQSCPTLRDPIDGSPRPRDSPGKNTGVGCHFLLQWWKWKVKVKSLSHVQLLATPWTAAHQAPLSMGFSRQEYWSGVPLWTRWQFP